MPSYDIVLMGRNVTIGLSPPEFGYTADIDLPFFFTQTEDGAYHVHDDGTNYDRRHCSCEFNLPLTQQFNLSNFLRSNRQGRGISVTLRLVSGSGFFPFAPDKGDAGDFTVTIDPPELRGIQENPWLYFNTKLKMHCEGYPGGYVFTGDVADGCWRFGSVTDCRFPRGFFEPESVYEYDVSQGMDADGDIIDKGQDSDSYTTKVKMACNEAKATRIINYLATTARAATFNISVPSNYFPFGVNMGGSATFTVRSLNKRITVKHNQYNDFEFDLNLEKI